MDYKDLLITIGLMILITILYIVLKKFISWAIDDDDKWHKKHGHVGLKKDTLNANKKIAYDRLQEGYLLIMALLLLCVIKLIFDAV